MLRERAVDRALALAEHRGLGHRRSAAGWARDRALSVLEVQAARHGVPLAAAADRLEHDRAAMDELMTALRVGETRFYRDRAHWEAIALHVIPALPPGLEVRALSAGCSTGEEAYTLAMLLAAARRRFRVLGVDRSPSAIAAARAGSYRVEAARDLPPEWVSRFCEVRGTDLRVGAGLRELCAFEARDLLQRAPRGPFHLVLFKNVLLYLAAPAGEAVARRLVAELDEQGLLFVAASEIPRLRAAGIEPVRIAAGVTAFRDARKASPA